MLGRISSITFGVSRSSRWYGGADVDRQMNTLIDIDLLHKVSRDLAFTTDLDGLWTRRGRQWACHPSCCIAVSFACLGYTKALPRFLLSPASQYTPVGLESEEKFPQSAMVLA